MALPDGALRPAFQRRIWSAALLVVMFVLSILVTTLPYGRDEDIVGTDEALAELDTGDTAWMIVATGLVLFMTPGLAFFYGGMVRSMNLISTLLQSFVIMGLVMTLWTIVGYSLAFGKDAGGVIGDPSTFIFLRDVGAAPSSYAGTIPATVYCMYQATFAMITPALITGAVVERANFNAMMLFVALWHLLVYCPIAHMEWTPDGLIETFGHKDFAGGTVVHMTSGFSAFTLSWLLGARGGDKSTHHAPAHVPYVILGAAILWLGWQGFNGGSALSSGGLAGQAMLTTNVCTGASMMTWILWDYIQGRKVTAIGVSAGAVVGLVGITPGCGYVTVGAALIIGMVTASVCNFTMHYIKTITPVDDTLDVFAGHGMGGLVGMIMTSLFAHPDLAGDDEPGLFYGGWTLFWHTIVVAALVIAFSCIMTVLLYYVVNALIKFRVSEAKEREGLDSSVHGEVVHGFVKPAGFSMDDSRTAGFLDDNPLKATGGTAVTGSPSDSYAAAAPTSVV